MYHLLCRNPVLPLLSSSKVTHMQNDKVLFLIKSLITIFPEIQFRLKNICNFLKFKVLEHFSKISKYQFQKNDTFSLIGIGSHENGEVLTLTIISVTPLQRKVRKILLILPSTKTAPLAKFQNYTTNQSLN